MYSKDYIYLLGALIICGNALMLHYKNKIKTNKVLNTVILFLVLFTLNKSIQLGILLSISYLILNQ